MMRKAKFFLTFLFLLLVSETLLFANTSGYEISSKIYNKFYKKDLNIRTQNLISSGQNQFPFNVIIFFRGNNNSKDFFSKQVLFVIDQEQALQKTEFVENLIENLQKSSYDFDIQILLSYGDNQKVLKRGMICGTQCFINNSNTNENTTAIILDLQNTENKIITSSNSIASPSFLVKTGCDLFLKNDFNANLPFYYISQQNKFHFFVDNQLDFFFEQEIPAIKYCFSNEEEQNKICNFCEDFVQSFSKNKNYSWDQHFIIFKLPTKYQRLTEKNIVIFIIAMFFSCLVFFSLLSFINSNLQNQTWKKIRKIWFALPITFLIILGSFFLGKGVYLIFANEFSLMGKVVFLFSAQIILSFLFSAIYFVFRLKKGFINEKSLDFLLIFTTGLNLFVFSFIDISLFPLMFFMFLLAIIMLILKKRPIHIVVFVFMIAPFIPYIHTILSTADIFLFQIFFTKQNKNFIFESLIFTPIIFTYFRILTSFKTKLYSYKRLIITTTSSFCFIAICLGVTSIFVTKIYNKKITSKIPQINKINADLIETSFSDKKVFSETIRTLTVNVPENTLQCSVVLKTEKDSPILYSDYDFEVFSPTESSFKIPYKPGKEFSFVYGIENPQSVISIEIITGDEELSVFSSYKKTIKIGFSNE